MEPYPVNWPLDALYTTVTYAAQSLMNLVPEEDRGDCDMMDELRHFHTLDRTEQRGHRFLDSVDRMHKYSFSVIAEAMNEFADPSILKDRPWLSDAQQHQAILDHAVKYLQKHVEERRSQRFGHETPGYRG